MGLSLKTQDRHDARSYFWPRKRSQPSKENYLYFTGFPSTGLLVYTSYFLSPSTSPFPLPYTLDPTSHVLLPLFLVHRWSVAGPRSALRSSLFRPDDRSAPPAVRQWGWLFGRRMDPPTSAAASRTLRQPSVSFLSVLTCYRLRRGSAYVGIVRVWDTEVA